MIFHQQVGEFQCKPVRVFRQPCQTICNPLLFCDIREEISDGLYDDPHRTPSLRAQAHGLPYIPIKRLFQAVKFSIAMQRNDVHPDVADAEAAGNYGCNRELVENYTARALP
jgi:hypothetical protein